MPRFEWPLALVALLLLPLIARRSSVERAVPFSLFPDLRDHASSLRQRLLVLPRFLRVSAIGLIIVAIAQPRWGSHPIREIGHSRGIEVVLDRSGSMANNDMEYDGQRCSRFEAVQRISSDFIFGKGELPGRPADMVGLIGFAAEPVTFCPLTLSREPLRTALRAISVAHGYDDCTAIGDALAVTAARFQAAETGSDAEFKAKVIVLVTDGENNCGVRTPSDAAALARKWGVRVYVVALRPGARALALDSTSAYQFEAVAELTGGLFRVVSDATGLRDIYREIDRMEPSQVSVERYVGGTDSLVSLTLAAVALLLADRVLRSTRLRLTP